MKFQNSASHTASGILRSANFGIFVAAKFRKILKFKILSHARSVLEYLFHSK
ncbi:hypothetical protein [uncultured Campylobacter sp.]|uniref:hypothetical protein n=1 Tax=uncultured Campylobacter sp. TaxID=218934 RepID=UPI002609C20A|nr:hypothetical protein [uncultured Campylobacter sp.]